MNLPVPTAPSIAAHPAVGGVVDKDVEMLASSATTRPVVVLVSGSPGSGKTTLARTIGDALALPHLNKDRLRDGMRFTSGPGSTDESVVREVLHTTMERWLDAGVSHVVDFTTYLSVTESDVVDRVGQRAEILNVHCRSANAFDRFADRLARHPQLSPDEDQVATQRQRAEEEASNTSTPLPLGRPVIEVDTDAGYLPALEDIVTWILAMSARSLPLEGRAG